MKILYIDQVSGISGDMLFSALCDVASRKEINFILDNVPIEKKIRSKIQIRDVLKNGISAKTLVLPEKDNVINFSDIIKKIRKSHFNQNVKQKVIQTVDLIAETESKIHKITKRKFHFHNYYDLIVELFGIFYIIDFLCIERVFSSKVRITRGFVDTLHGKFPVPAPATIEMCKGLPIEYLDVPFETTTPTGVAILRVLNPDYDFPNLVIDKIGYGAGFYDLEIPNILRVFIGTLEKYLYNDTVVKLETNIDDLNPVVYEQLFEKLFEMGCLDVYLTNTIQKKSRPGILLSVITYKDKLKGVCDFIFKNTTTIGIRISECNRIKLERELKVFRTRYGNVRAKIIYLPQGEKQIRPEYEDLKIISKKLNVTIKDLMLKLENELNVQN